jgi:hypothetical protein
VSITKFRKGFAGAGPIVAILLGVAFIVGFLYTGRSPSGSAASGQVERRKAFEWEGVAAYQDELQGYMTQGRVPNATPVEEWRLRAGALSSALDRVAALVLAKRAGIEVTDEAVEAKAKEEANWIVDLIKTQVQSQYDQETGRLTEEAQKAKETKGEQSEEYKQAKKALDEHKAMSLEEFAKKVTGRSLSELLEAQREEMLKMSQDPIQRDYLRSQVARERLAAKYEASVDTSDGALRASYDEITFEKILISEASSGNPMAKAEEVVRRIRSGLPFEDAAGEYSDLKKPDGKADLSPLTLSRLDLLVQEQYRPVGEMKAGEVSDPVQTPVGVAIYRVTKVSPKVPGNFDQVKAERAKVVRQSLAASMVTRGIGDLMRKDSDKIVWYDDGWKLANQLKQLLAGEGAKGAERLKAFQELVQAAETATSDDPDLPVLIRYMAFNQLYAETTDPEQKKALEDQRLEIYAAVSNVTTSTSFLFEYVDLLLEKKRGEEALRTLAEIVNNSWEINDTNRENIKKVERLKVQAANLAPQGSEAVTALQSALDSWYESEKEQKAFEAEQEKAMKEAEEANRKELESQKQEQAAPGSQPQGGATGSAPEKPGGSGSGASKQPSGSRSGN